MAANSKISLQYYSLRETDFRVSGGKSIAKMKREEVEAALKKQFEASGEVKFYCWPYMGDRILVAVVMKVNQSGASDYVREEPEFDIVEVPVMGDQLRACRNLQTQLRDAGIHFQKRGPDEAISGDFFQIMYARQCLSQASAKAAEEKFGRSAYPTSGFNHSVGKDQSVTTAANYDFSSDELEMVVHTDFRQFVTRCCEREYKDMVSKCEPFSFNLASKAASLDILVVSGTSMAGGLSTANAALSELKGLYEKLRSKYVRIVVKCNSQQVRTVLQLVTNTVLEKHDAKLSPSTQLSEDESVFFCAEKQKTGFCKDLVSFVKSKSSPDAQKSMLRSDDSDSLATARRSMQFNGPVFVVSSSAGSSANACRILVYTGDLTRSHCDAIVNAANSRLVLGSGIAGAIKTAAGPQIQYECNEIVRKHGKEFREGEAAVTKGYNLPCKWVIHAVGPNGHYCRNEKTFRERLLEAYRSLLNCAVQQNVKSLGIPLLSAGMFLGDYSISVCAEAVWSALQDFKDRDNLTEIQLVNMDHDATSTLLRAVETFPKFQRFDDRGNASSSATYSSNSFSRPNSTSAKSTIPQLDFFSREIFFQIQKRGSNVTEPRNKDTEINIV